MLILVYVLYALALSAGLARQGLRARRVPSEETVRGGAPSERPERVLIVGSTGGTGRQLVRQALERGHVVTALARDPSRLPIEHPRLTVVRGDVLDYASVEAAVRGQDAVILALGHKRWFRPTRILSEGTRTLLQAMEAQDVPRFVCVTSLGIGDSAGRMGLAYTLFTIPVVLPFYFWDKTRQERAIAVSRVQWVIVRPGRLTNAAPKGVYRHGHRVGNVLWTVRISRADVADFMLNQLTDDRYLGSAPGVSW